MYSNLASTPGHALPMSHLEVTMELEDDKKNKSTKTYMICQFLGAGKARAMAVDPKNFALKLLQLAGVAARISSDVHEDTTSGKVFTFLPLHFKSGLPVRGFNLHLLILLKN